ncbi:hypothetical protein [Paractinoplanes toevensis]|uniref:Uncharacterized protein n=1 Tax=Paractinoplanes toevensis TaxID=571911 RepID=A0A919T4E2_9ACTN|nr:hypothetical protein [Actinoplanes toevensis]GIM88830.1 hypothetical protein Ato02nite_006230 [Actinoplanes toevensis]
MTAPALACPIDCALDHSTGDPGFHAEPAETVTDLYGKDVEIALFHDERGGRTGIFLGEHEVSLQVAARITTLLQDAIARGVSIPRAMR